MSAVRSSGVRSSPKRCPFTERVCVPGGPFQPVGTYPSSSRRGLNQSSSVATEATLAKSQQQAMEMSFFFILPNILLSGFMFPYEAMPKLAQLLAEALPLTHFLRIVRGITLKGASFADLRQELLFLSAILLVLLVLTSTRFQKKLV